MVLKTWDGVKVVGVFIETALAWVEVESTVLGLFVETVLV